MFSSFKIYSFLIKLGRIDFNFEKFFQLIIIMMIKNLEHIETSKTSHGKQIVKCETQQKQMAQ